MIPLERMPGFARWGAGLQDLLDRPEPLWVFGDLGTGVSTVARHLAERRGETCLDDVEQLEPALLERWTSQHPRGILASHQPPETGSLAPTGSRCLALRLGGLDEDPGAAQGCLAVLAAEEGITAPLPPSLHSMPCPGNLRGLRNRVVRWKLLGQLPEMAGEESGPGAPEAEDLATNLHHLERVLLHRALRRSFGNRVEAARRLGVSRRQLYLLIQRHGDPLRGEPPIHEGPKRLVKKQQGRRGLPGSPVGSSE